MTTHTFDATLERPDMKGAWTYIQVPLNVEEEFGSKARVAVKGSVNGVPFRSSLMPQGDGVHILVVNKGLRDQAGVDVGDSASFEIEQDNAPREVEVPEELREALKTSDEANANFDKLPYSHKKEYADYITEAKRSETRVRRAGRAVEMLAEGRRLK